MLSEVELPPAEALIVAWELMKVGVEASGNTRWFERLQKVGARDADGRCGAHPGNGGAASEDGRAHAEHLRQLLEREQFPEIWIPSAGSEI